MDALLTEVIHMHCFITWVNEKWQRDPYDQASTAVVSRVVAGLTCLATLSLPMNLFVRLDVAIALPKGVDFCRDAGVLI